jgi:glycosyltransferase involved in cell wall biosynthesis
MKIALLNTYDKPGGATRACLRLLSGLSAAGVESSMLVREKSVDISEVVAVGSQLDGFIRALIDGIPLHLYPNRQLHVFAPAWAPGRAIPEVSRLEPDLVHLHWVVNGFVRIEDMSALNCPVVWTLHDSWPFTGGCHLPIGCTRYEQSCGRCPVLGSVNENDLSRRVWKRKQKSWSDLPFTVVAPSRWIAEKARSSSLFRNRRIVIIPNGIDTAFYCPGDKIEARKKLGLPENCKLILFGAIHALSDLNKGLDLLQSAISSVNFSHWQNTELILFGVDEGATLPDCGMPVRCFEFVTDEEQMVLLYRAADLFIVPSRQETFPYVIMEAMSCGTPCVAFSVGGIPDLITHGETGYLATPYIVDDLATGIVDLLDNEKLRTSMAVKSRRSIEDNFSLQLMAQRYINLYQNLISGVVSGL